jgi:hypothetical protein
MTMNFIQNIKEVIKNNKDKVLSVIIAVVMTIAVLFFVVGCSPAEAHGWHDDRWHGGIHVYISPIVPMPYHRVIIEGGNYNGYYSYRYPYYMVNPSRIIIEVQEYDRWCGCYILIKQYEDRWGNRYPYP